MVGCLSDLPYKDLPCIIAGMVDSQIVVYILRLTSY
jgi:hypothetical protein